MECPNTSPECRYWKNKHGCRQNTHHLYYPKNDYTTPVEKEFRELQDNKVVLCMVEHDQLHKIEQPPMKPSRDEMLMVINGIRRAS